MAMEVEEAFAHYLHIALVRELFERCIKGELGIESFQDCMDNTNTAIAVRIYMKDVILDAFIKAIEELKHQDNRFHEFSLLLTDVANEATAELNKGSMPYGYNN